MDPLSIATSLAGLAGFAIQIAPSLQSYFSDIKHAKADVARYANEIYSLVEVCKRLHLFLKTDAAISFETTESVFSRTVVSCDDCLRELARMLDGQDQEKSGLGTWARKMKWPIYKKQVEKIVSCLARYTQLFQFALTVEGCAVLSRTPEDVTAILQLQHDTASKLHDITKGIAALKVSAEEHRNTADRMTSILEGIQSFTDPSLRLIEIQESVGTITRQLTDKQDKEVLDWLSPERGRGRHEEVRSRRTPGTGQWIFNTPAFKKWIDEESPQRLLWFVGAPGCGKSTLVSLVIDELKVSETSHNAAVAYYYCDYRIQVAQPLALVLSNILRLLVEQLDTIPASLQELFESCGREGRAPLSSELERILHSVSPLFSRCFILVDAIDEFSIDDSTQTAQLITLLDSLAAAGVQVLVTSRTLPMPSLKTSHVIETHSAAEPDIRSYVAHALQADDSMVDLLDSQLESDISNSVVEQAKGMFLLAVLYLQTIRGQVSRSGVRKALSRLSGDLSDAYDKTFEAIEHQSQSRQQLALKTLMWVSSSYRPLNSLELRHSLATQVEDTDLDVDNIPPLRLIVRSCCGLIAVDDLDDDCSGVRLVHHTLHQYLKKRQRVWLSNAHPMIAQTCLSYLLFQSLGARAGISGEPELRPDAESETQVNRDELVLKPFALEHWGHHAALCPPETYITPAMRFLTDSERLKALYPENNRMTGIHIAASFGLKRLVHELLTSGHQADSKDIREETPLHKACARNQKETAILLLNHGANPNIWCLAMTTPLFIAVENGNIELIKALLTNRAKIDLPCKDHWTALHKAADIGDLKIVKYLVSQGSSTSRASAWGLTALHRAAGRGHLDMIRFLLEDGGACIHSVTKDGWTPLHGAASSGQTGAISLLLKSGADIHGCCLNDRTPLHRAVLGGYTDTVEMLISHGADVMKKDCNEDLPLHIASREGHSEILDQLLEKGLQQLSHLNDDGWSPLQEAQLSGFHATERRLRQQAHKSLSRGNGNEDILTKAIQTDDVNAFKRLLLDKSIEIESRDTQGRTLLHQAFHAESYSIASTLLSCGANIHAKFETGGWQAIHYAALSGNPRAVQLCLDHGADADSRTQHGQTPLHHACRNGNEETVQLLLDRNVDITTVDNRKWGALHNASAAGHKAIVRLLVLNGRLDTKLWTWNWVTIQACAANRGHHEMVEMIRAIRYSENYELTRLYRDISRTSTTSTKYSYE